MLWTLYRLVLRMINLHISSEEDKLVSIFCRKQSRWEGRGGQRESVYNNIGNRGPLTTLEMVLKYNNIEKLVDTIFIHIIVYRKYVGRRCESEIIV